MKTSLTIQCLGNLGNASEIKDINGKKYLCWVMAHNNKYTNSKGEEIQQTQWVNCLYRLKNDTTNLELKKGIALLANGELSVKLFDTEKSKNNIGISMQVHSFTIIGEIVKQTKD